MGLFRDWARSKVDRGVLIAAVTPDLVYGVWSSFEAAHYPMFSAYERSLAGRAASPADIDPDQRLAAAKGDPNARNGAATLFQELDTFSTHVETQSSVQAQREAADLRANRAPVRNLDDADGDDLPTVRLQLQLNYKQKGGGDTIATEVIRSAGGVSAASVDTAFERLVTNSGLKRRLVDQLRECYAIHKSKWLAYSPGTSYSVYFDENDILTSGRPKGGYRLDVENLRTGTRANFT